MPNAAIDKRKQVICAAWAKYSSRGDRADTVLDPNQAGNVDLRLEQALSGFEGKQESLPIIRLSGFFQLDDGLYSQPAASRERIGDALDGVSFRRTRLQAFGKLTPQHWA